MEIREQIVIEAPLKLAWPLLQNVNLIAGCLPGAKLEGELDDEKRHQGTLTVQFGPTKVTFLGNVLFEVVPAEHRVDLKGRGRDGRGRNRASVDLTVLALALGEDKTELVIYGNIDVVGPLERFAATGGRHLAQELLGTFASNVASRLESVGVQSEATGLGGEPEPATVRGTDGSGEALSFGRLLWRALSKWLRGLGRRSSV